jgi:hypothetical protein
MSNEIKKMTLKYSYLVLEKEDVSEACKSVEVEIRSCIKEQYPEYYKFFYDNVSEKQQTEKQDKTDNKNNKQKNKDLKKLYRRIAEKTHPDRSGTNDTSKMFSDAAKAYSNNDIAKLLEISSGLNIELSHLSEESLLLLRNNIENLSQEINNMKQTPAWAWHNANDEEKKEKIIIDIITAIKNRRSIK